MFRLVTKRCLSSSSSLAHQVTILGASGGIGQPLSLLLKSNPKVTKLNLYDLKLAHGVATDLSHINTKSTIKGFDPSENSNALNDSLKGTDVVVIPAGVPRKPGMTRDDLFSVNAGIIAQLANAVSQECPKAKILVISNPVNSTVPVFAEVLKKNGVWNEKYLMGVTTLDSVRASRFVSELKGTDPKDEDIKIVGGHSGITIVPLLSQSRHQFSAAEREALIKRIQFGGDEVVKAKNGAGSATLSMAFAGARFTDSVLKGLNGETGVVEAAYVYSPLFKNDGIDFFATKVTLGKDGVESIGEVGPIDAEEQQLLEKAKETLKANIDKGANFVKQQ